MGFRPTRRRRSRILEEELRLANAKFAGIVGIAADAIISVNEAQRIVLFNRGAEEIFGYVPDEIIGQPLTVLLPEGARQVHTKHVSHFAVSGVSARHMGTRSVIQGRRKNGDIFPAEASISKVDLGTTRLFTAVLRDVTERTRLLEAEQEARAAAEAAAVRSSFLAEASALLDRSLDRVTTLDTLASVVVPALADCCLVDLILGDGSVRRLGFAHADPARADALQGLRAYPTGNQLGLLIDSAVSHGRTLNVRSVTKEWIDAHTESDEHRALVRLLAPASYVVIPLSARGQIFGAMAFMRCDTPRPYSDAEVALCEELAHRAAQAIENARLYGAAQHAIRARDDVLSVVSHDLRNPLSAIAMCNTTLLEQPPEDINVRNEMLEMIGQSVDWMNRIIQDLLDIASIEAGKLSLHPRHSTVAEVLEQARPTLEALAKAHRFEVTIAPGLPHVSVDADRIAQVLSNLVGNAAKFTPEGGLIELDAERDGEGAVRISVRDEGSGIPADHLPHIFDRFWHSRGLSGKRGTGLGLAISMGIVEAHGGRIWAESKPGRGSTFRFTIPAD